MKRREEKIVSLFQSLIAEFLLREFGGKVLISITRMESCGNLKLIKIFVSIYPEGEEKAIFSKLAGKKPEIRKYLGSKITLKFTPELEFILDKGEKNRQKIEELLKKAE